MLLRFERTSFWCLVSTFNENPFFFRVESNRIEGGPSNINQSTSLSVLFENFLLSRCQRTFQYTVRTVSLHKRKHKRKRKRVVSIVGGHRRSLAAFL
jgi:hypothetical protein